MTAFRDFQNTPIVSFDHDCVIVPTVEDLILVFKLFPAVCTVPSNMKCKHQVGIGIIQAVVENFDPIILVFLLQKVKRPGSKNELRIVDAHRRPALIIEIVAVMLQPPLLVGSDHSLLQINHCRFIIKVCSSPYHLCHFYFLPRQLVSA